jgi:hypothetical protein
MIQDKLLQPGKVILVRLAPHMPAMGQLEVLELTNGMIKFRYTRNDDQERRVIDLSRHHSEYMIVHGFWTDPEEVREKPLANESQIDGLWDEVRPELRDALTRATYWFERHDFDQIKDQMHKALDSAIEERMKELKG